MTQQVRAGRMAPDQRRRAIADAVTPLLVVQGPAVTSRQMAEAAGVAEGTIFKVFKDKCGLVVFALERAADPEPLRRGLAGIDGDAPFEEQVRAAASLLQDRLGRVLALAGALRSMAAYRPGAGMPPTITEAGREATAAVAALFERHRHRLRIEPSRAAVLLSSMVLAASLPAEPRPTLDEVVDVVLHGVSADGGSN